MLLDRCVLEKEITYQKGFTAFAGANQQFRFACFDDLHQSGAMLGCGCGSWGVGEVVKRKVSRRSSVLLDKCSLHGNDDRVVLDFESRISNNQSEVAAVDKFEPLERLQAK